MLRSRPRSAAEICWQCQWRLTHQRQAFGHRYLLRGGAAPRAPRRALHATHARTQTELASSNAALTFDPALVGSNIPQVPIRDHLQAWQRLHSGPDEATLSAFENHPAHAGEIQNNLVKLSFDSKADEANGADEWANEDDEDEELVTIGLFLKPGDVVELSQPGREPVLAVFVQQLETNSQFFSVNGRWCHSRLTRITFAVPACVDPALVQALVPFMPTKPEEVPSNDTNQAPRNLGAPIQAVLLRLTEDSERIYRNNAPVLDTAYSTLADASRTRMMTLSQIAKTLLSKGDASWTPSPPALLAVRKALNHNEFRFRSDARSQRLTNVFAIRPKNDVEVVEIVQEWIREYKEHQAGLVNTPDSARNPSDGTTYVDNFIAKARRLIAISRQHREPLSGFISPSQTRIASKDNSTSQVTWGEYFTTTDKQIINFLQAWVLTDQFNNMPNLHSSCTAILSFVGLYEPGDIKKNQGTRDAMGRDMGHVFLQEIGVITPHENRSLYDEQLMLPTVRLSRNLDLLNTKAELTRRSPDFRDSMAHLRQDWGDMTVWCIDDADAKEIDDGVSIQRVPGKDSEFWIHVHVANPTAFFEKTHVLSGLAAHMTETVYTPERSFPMLPAWASHDYFSLGRNRPTITFSTRIDAAGNTLEKKIQHGIIRKVQTITYSELSTLLGEPEGKVNRLVVGGEIPSGPRRALPTLSPTELQELRDLLTAAKSCWAGRKAAGGVSYAQQSQVNVRVFEDAHHPGLPWMSPSTDRSRLMHSDPIIELTAHEVETGIPTEVNSGNIVLEMMLLACCSAASWCAERNIPVMFRGTVEPPTSGMSLEKFQQNIVFPQLQKQGFLSPGVALRYTMALGRAIAHSAPIPHKTIGTKAYVKVTSPLRRFSDMIAHWQIEAAIRHEARTGEMVNSALLASSTRPILPFSQRQMQESIITLSPREKIIATTNRGSTHFWSLQAFMRAYHYNEAPLPETLTCWIRMVNHERWHTAILSDIGVRVCVNPIPGMEFHVGDQWEVKLQRIDMFMRSLHVSPVRLLQRDDDDDFL
ncbi:RNB-domain-containing protein [Massarina eburnea CBS 473.64]|uniref:RNB-domain-containing protein n=1 Tax=Massarina eburnea CBS 473.64 TaxID=1395130 RepID=A0A6A6SA84_9PLEO|nr:RNB-domain-containing protein [Massarina eburnea CBS 473.64]